MTTIELNRELTITEARAWLAERGIKTSHDSVTHNCRVGNITARKNSAGWLITVAALERFAANPPRPGPRARPASERYKQYLEPETSKHKA